MNHFSSTLRSARFALAILMAIAGSLLANNSAQAQGFVTKTGTGSPVNSITTSTTGASPSLADLDGDNDLDLVLTSPKGAITFFGNNGTKTNPIFAQTTSPIPPPSQGSADNLNFSFGDLDGDGDLDGITGNLDGKILTYINSGTKTNPIFAQAFNPAPAAHTPVKSARVSSQSFFDAFDYANEGYTYVRLADFDNDGDLDALVITRVAIHYLRNTGSSASPSYIEITGCDSPFNGIVRSGSYTNPVVADVDGDGDLDVALSGSPILYYRNIGTRSNPRYIQITGTDNPFNTIDPGFGSQLEVGDLDGDGDPDIIAGLFSGSATYLQNVLQFSQQPSPASQVTCGGGSVSTTVQVAVGGEYAYQWYRNAQTTETPVNGQTSPTLTLSNVQPGDAGVYYVRVSGNGGSIFSDAFNVVVQSVVINAQPASSSTVSAGANVVVPVGVSGPVTSYQWYRNGQAVGDQTTSVLTLNNVSVSQAGSYALVVTSPCNSLTSNTFALTVQGGIASVYGSKTVSGNFVEGGSITYTIELTNYGTANQANNFGPELVDTLPSGLSLVSATASSDTVKAQTSTNTVTWSGSIATGGSVSITINAIILSGKGGQTISNQATINYDGDGNGSNEASRQTDDPGQEGDANSTSFVVAANCPPMSLSLTNDGPLNCEKPSVLLTVTAPNSTSYTYVFSAGATQIGSSIGNTATVTSSGVYSVTARGPDGCKASAQTTVTSTQDAPSLAASALTTINQPISITATGCGAGSVNWNPQGGTGTANGSVYTFTQPGSYTLTANCGIMGCTSNRSNPVVVSIQSGGFAIGSVTMVSCQLFDVAKGGYNVTFSPQFSGQNSNPISFSVVNEKLLTTAPPPYMLRLYTDNPAITLVANQAGNAEARYRFEWLAACQSGNTTNHPPVTTVIPNQTILQGQAYQLDLKNYFSDPDQQSLTFSAQGLPNGLTLTGSLISGTPSTTGVSSVSITAVDPGNLSVSTSFQLTVSPMPTTPTGFTITGVSTVSCEVLSPGERRITFTPQYAGTSGGPISFSVVSEKLPTTDPGPYTLNLYTDNPTITLKAVQNGNQASFAYNWLAACNAGGRLGLPESAGGLQVRVLGNPVEGKSAEIEISGVEGQSVLLELVDQQGRILMQNRINKIGQTERVSVPVSTGKSLFLLQVSTSTQRQQVKLLKP